jgi:hypothetical protein
VTANASGAPAVLVQLNQTTPLSAGAITFDGTYDGTNWTTMNVAQVLNPATFANLTNPYTLVSNINQPFMLLTQGFLALRIRLSTAITGAGTVTPFVTVLPQNPTISSLLNPLATGTNIIGKVGIDQTTPGTTDAVSLGTDPCTFSSVTKVSTPISQIASTQIIAGIGGKKTYICSIALIAGAAETVNLIESPSATCVTTANAIIGSTTVASGLALAANGGLTFGNGTGTIAIVGNATGDNVCLSQLGHGQISGVITYGQN